MNIICERFSIKTKYEYKLSDLGAYFEEKVTKLQAKCKVIKICKHVGFLEILRKMEKFCGIFQKIWLGTVQNLKLLLKFCANK